MRMLLRTHLHTWSVQETEDQADQNLIRRWFCRLSWRETLHQLGARTAELARQAKATRGRTLRLDGTCEQTAIPHPTDGGLLVDRVRTLGRLVLRARGIRGDGAAALPFPPADRPARGPDPASARVAHKGDTEEAAHYPARDHRADGASGDAGRAARGWRAGS